MASSPNTIIIMLANKLIASMLHSGHMPATPTCDKQPIVLQFCMCLEGFFFDAALLSDINCMYHAKLGLLDVAGVTAVVCCTHVGNTNAC